MGKKMDVGERHRRARQERFIGNDTLQPRQGVSRCRKTLFDRTGFTLLPEAGAKNPVRENLPDHRPVAGTVGNRDDLVLQSPSPGSGRLQGRAGELLVDIPRYGGGFVDNEFAVLKDRHPAKRIQTLEMFRR
ncbi:MAG TPA: hypothetical protein VKN63_00360 [Afifellaceae bacterium]|nr:hypothetical protein [Afifellaceae bacterium]